MNEDRLREALREAPVPELEAAEERGRRVALAAFDAAPPVTAPRRRHRRLVELGLAVLLVFAVISPAGASVRHWIADVADTGRSPSEPALTALPAPGRLLVDSPLGPWVVRSDGSKRLLGSYGEATWSPHGLFVAATEGHQLAALTPEGEVRWSLATKSIPRDVRWSPDGFRIAYRAGHELRVVAGDGTEDQAAIGGVEAVAPAWRPGSRHVIAVMRSAGRVEALDADSGKVLFAAPVNERPRQLLWLGNPTRLLVVGAAQMIVLGPHGEVLRRTPPPAGMRFVAAAANRQGTHLVAIASRTGPRPESRLLAIGADGSTRQLFAGLGRFGTVLYSPDRRWLLLTWPSADQWLFLRHAKKQQIRAYSEITAQFAPGAPAVTGFPVPVGWCC